VPAVTNVDSIVETPNGYRGDIEEIRSRRELQVGDQYNMVGSVSTATAEQLASAGVDYADWVQQRYLQLPKNLPDRVRAEAETVAASGANPYEQAQLIESYLRDFPFDLAVASAPPGEDVVDFFLFEQKRGYFDYQSTAMAVMLRSIGIPSRVAVGYVLDPAEVAEGGVYTVRKDDAYSWVEVYFPQYGWVNFNPTRDRPEGGAGSAINGGETSLTTPSLEELFPDDFFEPLPGDVGDAASQPPVLANPDTGGSAFNWIYLYVLGGLLAAAAIVALSVRTAWNWGLGG
jgi:transglutaminase-like putative cysteine protease